MPTCRDLFTPALVLDRTRLNRNAARMTQRAQALKVKLRPHLKTAKSIDVARIALAGNFGGITVSTLKEAEYFAAHGLRDVFYPVGIVPDKLPRAAALVRAGVELRLAVDSWESARSLAAAGARLGVAFECLLEVDCGEHRGGFAPDAAELVAAGKLLSASPGARFRGVFTHGGHSYGQKSAAGIIAVAEQERVAVTSAATALRVAGITCEEVSLGSTPTATHAADLVGVTELRAGVYLFGDLFQAGIGSHTPLDIAAWVVASVLAHRPAENQLVIDAGSLALSKDRSTAALPPEQDAGFGRVLTLEGTGDELGLGVAKVYQEHGMVSARRPIPFAQFPLSSRVRVLPNHACLTCAQYDRYHVTDEAGEITAEWPRINGW